MNRNFGASKQHTEREDDLNMGAWSFALLVCFAPFAAVALAVLAYGWWKGLFA